MQRGFTKLFNTLLTSTIWQEDDKTRIVWITMLALAGPDGVVNAAVPGLASIANVSVDAARAAIKKLIAPDSDSRTKDFDGRRIEAIDGGWLILNYGKYRQMLTEEARREYQRAWIANKRAAKRGKDVIDKSMKSRQAEAEAEAEAESTGDKHTVGGKAARKARPTGNDEEWLLSLEKDETYKLLNIRAEYGKMRNWCAVRGVMPTRRRFINWLNRSERPMSANGPGNNSRPMSAFEIEKRCAAISEEMNKLWRKHATGGHPQILPLEVAAQYAELKARRNELQKELTR